MMMNNRDKIKELQGQIKDLEKQEAEEKRREREARIREENEKNERIRAELLEKHGLTGSPYADTLMSFAWEHGHSSGWSDIECWLLEAMDLMDKLLAVKKPKADRFYILDTRQRVGNCALWWGPNFQWYTSNIEDAGVYTRAEAMAQERSRNTDQAWPAHLVERLVGRHVRVDTEAFQQASSERERLLAIDLKDKPPAIKKRRS